MKKAFILVGLALATIVSCKKEDAKNTTPASTTSSISNTDPNIITFNPNINYGSVTDIDGNVYKTVKIAGKEWMAENLKVKRYNDGTAIQTVEWKNNLQVYNIEWMESGLDTWKYFSTDSLKASMYFKTYGLQYNWAVVNNSKNVCPQGWRVPTATEFTNLINSQGGMYLAGNKLIETTTAHWKGYPNATNSSGFTALPSGGFIYGTLYNDEVLYWSSTSDDHYDSDSIFRNKQAKVLSFSDVSKVEIINYNKVNGTVIRCLKD